MVPLSFRRGVGPVAARPSRSSLSKQGVPTGCVLPPYRWTACWGRRPARVYPQGWLRIVDRRWSRRSSDRPTHLVEPTGVGGDGGPDPAVALVVEAVLEALGAEAPTERRNRHPSVSPPAGNPDRVRVTVLGPAGEESAARPPGGVFAGGARLRVPGVHRAVSRAGSPFLGATPAHPASSSRSGSAVPSSLPSMSNQRSRSIRSSATGSAHA